MRARAKILVPAVVVVVSLASAPWAAADDLVQFQTTSTGTRVLTAAVAPSFPAVYDLNIADHNIESATSATSLVTETFKTGNAWNVKAQMCGPNSYATPTSGDCVAKPARMERADGQTIAGSTISVSHLAPVVTAGGGTTSSGSEANLGGQITLLNNTGQDTSTTYSGTYASSTSFTINNLDRIGVWKGMWVVTATL